MKIPNCPYCSKDDLLSGIRIVRAGCFRRKSDSRRIQRFRCLKCLKYFSLATFSPAAHQNKRHLNHRLSHLLASCVSLRRSAKLLRISRTTVKRKLIFLGTQALRKIESDNIRHEKAQVVEFDELETFEHTKMKPLSIPIAVVHGSRRILGFQVSQMAAKGPLAAKARKKYGFRKDTRSHARKVLFHSLKGLVEEDAIFKSDENPHYPRDLKSVFPKGRHLQFKGQRGSVVGQGELKKIRFDPIFSLNHTCAMLRANINRLVRKTWCTTKLQQMLLYHLAIYVDYHNSHLIESS